MDVSLNTAQDRITSQSSSTTTQAAPQQEDLGGFAAMLQQNTFRFGGMSGLPFAAKTLAAVIDKPQQVAPQDRPAPTQNDNKSARPLASGNTHASSRSQTSNSTNTRQRETPSAATSDDGQATVMSDTTQTASTDTTRSEATNDNTTSTTAQTRRDGNDDAEAQTNNIATEATQAVQAVVASAEMRSLNGTAQSAKIAVNDENNADTKNDAVNTLFGNTSQQQGPTIAATDTKDTHVAKAQVATTAADDQDTTSLFALTMSLQAGAAAASRQAGKVAGTGGTTGKDANTAGQTAELSQMLGSGDRLAITVSAHTDIAKPIPLSAAALVPSAMLAGTELNEMAQNMSQQTPGQNVGGQSLGGRSGADEAFDTLASLTGQPSEPTQPNAGTQQPSTFAEALSSTMAAAGDGAPAAQTGATKTDSTISQIGGAQGTSQTSGAQNTQNAQTTQQTRAPHMVQVPQTIEQVKVNIGQALADGSNHIIIQLTPEQLGRVEVRMDVGQNGQVQAVITADRPETLALLKQDAGNLERSLQDAGLKPDTDSLSFNLRGDTQQQQQQFAEENNSNNSGNNGRSNGNNNDQALDDRDLRLQAARIAAEQRTVLRGGLDVSI